MFLVIRKEDSRSLFCPPDQAVDLACNRLQPRIVYHGKALADVLFRQIVGHEEHHRPVVQIFHVDLARKGHLRDVVLDLLHGQIQHLSSLFTKLILWQKGIPFSREISQGELDPALDPEPVVVSDSHFFCDLIRLFEPDAENIIHKLIRIFLNGFDGISTVHLVQLHGII